MVPPAVDVMDETFLVVSPMVLAKYFADPAVWREWWPRLQLTVTKDRGSEGMQWSVSGELAGSAEIWLEPWRDGVVVHWFLRADPVAGTRRWFGLRRPDPARIRRAYVTSFKRHIHALKDEVERDRAPGTSRAAAAERGSGESII
ncbi:polyketide cyclase / dehydrase and lipid transport [Actinobacteria bacterium YIM 96077]|uniref:Polyketide cyclase / dehydrase and lipid transport n=1 Tax=Phytoactinopolyspora halophila TaxID=1981511 RepID=A0A329QHL3_9ACTN|nr:polyketide cyclase / dehydrase and lipid transport [Phytoactinopolyspora halophila]AYY13665.1 polyketide cyclase / dehydrase and lipid transport [Actinobacteria bacterium YIM 96077]RAW11229.1 polyketide cyclase / dehydrase and lipid transport [Phytoactinopolyspora halophila]